MENIILIVLGATSIAGMIVLIKTLVWQKKVSTHLPLSKIKNNRVVLKQGSFLLLSVFVFGFVFNQQGYFANTNDMGTMSEVDSRGALEAASDYAQSSDDEESFDALNKLENEEVIGLVTLENDIKYVLVRVNDQYYLVTDQENKVIEIESAP